MSDDIEAFLRRAAEQRSRRQMAEAEVLETYPAVDAEIIEAEPAEPGAAWWSAQQHGGPPQQAGQQPPSKRQKEVLPGPGGDLMSVPLEQAFQTLGDRVEQRPEDADAYAHVPHVEGLHSGDLAKLLRAPQGLRQAIVLSEILTRPEHRW